MSYQKQIWNNGDIITDQKLNHIEEGIKNISSNFIQIPIEFVEETCIIKKTLQELYNLMQDNNILYFVTSVNNTTGMPLQFDGLVLVMITNISINSLTVFTNNRNITFLAESTNDYPKSRTSS